MIGSVYELLWLFLIYAFLGWCLEVAYSTLNTGKFVNRGFLNGAICPIYGFGVVIVIFILDPIKENTLILFLGSIILTSVLELITGAVLEKIFHNRWWDYSHLPFNLCGYICLKFSIMWGIACVFILEIIHPAIQYLIKIFPYKIGLVFIIIIMSLFVIDTIVTINAVLKLNRKLFLMDQISEKLEFISEELGENISNSIVEIVEKRDEWKDNLDEKRLEFSRLKKSYKILYEEKYFIHKRLMKAFPSMKSKKYQEVLDNLKLYYKNMRKK